jgi:hypothetical protein
VDSEVRTGVAYEVRDGWRESAAATEKSTRSGILSLPIALERVVRGLGLGSRVQVGVVGGC